jgi:hypothetical protein
LGFQLSAWHIFVISKTSEPIRFEEVTRLYLALKILLVSYGADLLVGDYPYGSYLHHIFTFVLMGVGQITVVETNVSLALLRSASFCVELIDIDDDRILISTDSPPTSSFKRRRYLRRSSLSSSTTPERILRFKEPIIDRNFNGISSNTPIGRFKSRSTVVTHRNSYRRSSRCFGSIKVSSESFRSRTGEADSSNLVWDDMKTNPYGKAWLFLCTLTLSALLVLQMTVFNDAIFPLCNQ